MAELEPSYATGLCYTPQDDRLILGGLVCEEGVEGFADLRVTTEDGTTMNVVVSPGGAFVANDNDGVDSEQGMYHVFNTEEKVIAVDPNVSGVTRTDTVWLKVCDSAFSIAPSGFEIYYTPDETSEPGDGCSYYKLATIAVPNGASAITGTPSAYGVTDGMITDERETFLSCSERRIHRTRWTRSTAQAINDDVITRITFPAGPSGSAVPNDIYSESGGVITFLQSCVILVVGRVAWEAFADNTERSVQIRQNGSNQAVVAGPPIPSGTLTTSQEASAALAVAAGDTLDMTVRHTAVGAIDVISAALTITRLGVLAP